MAFQPTVTPTSISTPRRSSTRFFGAILGLISVVLAGCGTLTGIPAHGGGKRFATEQRLVSASIRSALMDIDVTPLKGKRAALIFDLVADEGGGSFNGGRWSPGLLFSVGTMTSPVTTTSNAFQVYNLAETGSSYSNTSSGGGSTSVTTTQQSGSNSNTGTSSTDGTSTNTSTTTNSGTSSTSGTSTDTSTTTNSGTSSGTSSSNTGGTNTNTNFNQTDNSTNVTNGSGSSTSTSTNSGTSATTGSGTNASSTDSSSSGTTSSQGTTTTTNSNNGSNRTSGGYGTNRQTIAPNPTETTSITQGTRKEHTATLAYRGLGEYQNFSVPKSDASLLMGLVRSYMMLNGVTPTTPNDPSAEVLVYVTVDIFGTVRSRFDAVLYNNETVKAETSFEVMAFDKTGKNILRPQVANREARYREHYLLWTGPITSQEHVYQGQGLLVDFTKVDGSKSAYNSAAPIERGHMGGKN